MLFTAVKMHCVYNTNRLNGIYDACIIRFSTKRAMQCKQNHFEKNHNSMTFYIGKYLCRT